MVSESLSEVGMRTRRIMMMRRGLKAMCGMLVDGLECGEVGCRGNKGEKRGRGQYSTGQ